MGKTQTLMHCNDYFYEKKSAGSIEHSGAHNKLLLIVSVMRYIQQGSHFFGLTKFHDISMIFPGFLVNFQVLFSLFLKYDFQVVLNINMQTY